jgi:hypothetical protein
MIHTNEQFEVVRQQLGRIQNALLSMRDRVLPKNKRNYQVLVEGYVDQIDLLQADIDAYLQIGLEPIEGDREDGPRISTNDEFVFAHKHLSRMEAALAALRQDVLPKNKRDYEVYAEGYIDQIAKLRAEIDAYLGIGMEPIDPETPALESDQVDQPIHQT